MRQVLSLDELWKSVRMLIRVAVWNIIGGAVEVRSSVVKMNSVCKCDIGAVCSYHVA